LGEKRSGSYLGNRAKILVLEENNNKIIKSIHTLDFTTHNRLRLACLSPMEQDERKTRGESNVSSDPAMYDREIG